MNLILFGYKGCGKTTIGRALAHHLKRPFLDTDRLLEELHLQQTGMSMRVREIHKLIGEEAFRALESETLQQLSSAENAIISLGGGFILDPENAASLAKLGQLVYLKLDKETLKKRVLKKGVPTFLDPGDPEGSYERMYAARKPVYEQIPAISLDLDHKHKGQILQELCTLIQQLEK